MIKKLAFLFSLVAITSGCSSTPSAGFTASYQGELSTQESEVLASTRENLKELGMSVNVYAFGNTFLSHEDKGRISCNVSPLLYKPGESESQVNFWRQYLINNIAGGLDVSNPTRSEMIRMYVCIDYESASYSGANCNVSSISYKYYLVKTKISAPLPKRYGNGCSIQDAPPLESGGQMIYSSGARAATGYASESLAVNSKGSRTSQEYEFMAKTSMYSKIKNQILSDSELSQATADLLNVSSKNDRSSLQRECTSLGFEPGTEKFENCMETLND